MCIEILIYVNLNTNLISHTKFKLCGLPTLRLAGIFTYVSLTCLLFVWFGTWDTIICAV